MSIGDAFCTELGLSRSPVWTNEGKLFVCLLARNLIYFISISFYLRLIAYIIRKKVIKSIARLLIAADVLT